MPYMDNKNAKYLVDAYADMVLRISLLYLKQSCDAEDICQEVFLKLLTADFVFKSPAHEKAWIIRATINACKDHLRTSFWKRATDLENAKEIATKEDEQSELLDMVMELPKNYRLSIYLHYYEDYPVNEIATMLGKSANTVSAYLSRGRKRLKNMLEESTKQEEIDTRGAIHYVK